MEKDDVERVWCGVENRTRQDNGRRLHTVENALEVNKKGWERREIGGWGRRERERDGQKKRV